MKNFIKISTCTILLFVLLDYIIGKKIINYLEKKNIFVTFDQNLKKNKKNEKKFRKKSELFSHTLSKNYRGISYFGNKAGEICTDKNGFKSKCGKKNDNFFDYGFIGDSFTEGVGLSYEKTFVGIFEESSKKNVANLGVSSYSPIIYYHKLKYFIENDIKFNHVIIFLDISDIEDEHSRIECDGKVCNKKINIFKDIRSSKISYIFKNLIQNDLNFTLLSLQYLKKSICKNIIFSKCSYVYDRNFLKSNWINNFKKNTSIEGIYYKPFKQTVFYLDKTFRLLQENNIDYSLAIYPWPGNILYNEKINDYENYFKNFCLNRCKHFFNYFDDFKLLTKKIGKKAVIKKYYFYGDLHYNEYGNQIIANKLEKILTK